MGGHALILMIFTWHPKLACTRKGSVVCEMVLQRGYYSFMLYVLIFTFLTKFSSLSRDFSLDLTPSRQVFAPGVKFLLNKKETTGYDPRTFYQGRVVGE